MVVAQHLAKGRGDYFFLRVMTSIMKTVKDMRATTKVIAANTTKNISCSLQKLIRGKATAGCSENSERICGCGLQKLKFSNATNGCRKHTLDARNDAGRRPLV